MSNHGGNWGLLGPLPGIENFQFIHAKRKADNINQRLFIDIHHYSREHVMGFDLISGRNVCIARTMVDEGTWESIFKRALFERRYPPENKYKELPDVYQVITLKLSNTFTDEQCANALGISRDSWDVLHSSLLDYAKYEVEDGLI